MDYTILDCVLFLIVEKQTVDTLIFVNWTSVLLGCILWEGRVVLRNYDAIVCFEGVWTNEKLLTMEKLQSFIALIKMLLTDNKKNNLYFYIWSIHCYKILARYPTLWRRDWCYNFIFKKELSRGIRTLATKILSHMRSDWSVYRLPPCFSP